MYYFKWKNNLKEILSSLCDDDLLIIMCLIISWDNEYFIRILIFFRLAKLLQFQAKNLLQVLLLILLSAFIAKLKLYVLLSYIILLRIITFWLLCNFNIKKAKPEIEKQLGKGLPILESDTYKTPKILFIKVKSLCIEY